MGLFDRLQAELNAQKKAEGLSMSDVVMLPDPLPKMVRYMLRERDVTLTDMVAFLGQDELKTSNLLATLVEKGFVREMVVQGEKHYRVRLAHRRGAASQSSIWQSLDKKIEE